MVPVIIIVWIYWRQSLWYLGLHFFFWKSKIMEHQTSGLVLLFIIWSFKWLLTREMFKTNALFCYLQRLNVLQSWRHWKICRVNSCLIFLWDIWVFHRHLYNKYSDTNKIRRNEWSEYDLNSDIILFLYSRIGRTY